MAPPPDEPAARGGRWKRPLLLALLLGAVALFFAAGGPRYLSLETLQRHRGTLLDFRDRHYALVLAGAMLAYTASTALSIPGGLLLSLAMGFLFGRWVGTAAVVASATAGATLAMLAARYLFAEAARRRMGPRLQRLVAGYGRDAFSFILFTRLVPVFPFWLMNLVPAFTPVRARTFAAATALGIVPGTFVFVNLGQSLGSLTSLRGLLQPAPMVALALLGVLSLLPVLLRRLRVHPDVPVA